jgi:monoterpene epsilon-lactone hydrolase
MTSSAIEKKARARLPIIRFMQVYMPLRIMHWLVKKGLEKVQMPADVTRRSVDADGVPCDWLIPEQGSPERVLLYLHGGGFVIPQTPNHLLMGAYLARQTGFQTMMVDYRVAPRHPFPAPLDDCVTAYRWLLQQGFSAHNIVIAGDSAGGNLTLTTLMTLRDAGDPMPCAAACLSPSGDLTVRDDTANATTDTLLHPKARKFYRDSYVGKNDPHNPLISPLYGNWHGLPPLLIHAGEDEVLKDDAIRINELASAAHVDVALEIYPNMWHVWQINLGLPQAIDSLNKIAAFLKSYCKP